MGGDEVIAKKDKSSFDYKVSRVDHSKVVNGKPITRFVVKDKVRNTSGEDIDYWVTVFDELDLYDGDYVRFLDFDQLTASFYTERRKINFFMSAIVEVIKKEYHTYKEKPVNNPYD